MRCHNCNEQVLMEDIMGVLPSGVCEHLVSRCRSCSGVVKIAMDKTHAGQHGKGPRIFDVNTKLATAMYHIGIGPNQLNNFLTTMNLPAVANKTIQRRCEEVGCTLEQLAEESTDRALQKEVEFTNTGSFSMQPNSNVESRVIEPVQNEDTTAGYAVQNDGLVQDDFCPDECNIEPGEFPTATLPLTEETVPSNSNIQSGLVE